MATIDKIRVSGVTYDIVDGSAVHSLDGYWTSGQTNDAITAATGALAETIAEQDYASKAYVQSAITEAGGTTTATVQTMIDESISGKAEAASAVTDVSTTATTLGNNTTISLRVFRNGTEASSHPTVITIGSGFTYNSVGNTVAVDTSVIAAKSDIPSVSGYADAVEYDSNSKEMKFYHGGTGGTEVFSFDASPFLIDGMVQNVEIKDVTISGESVTCLVISFNTDAGKQDINIPIEDIFDAANYYTKAEVDAALSGITESLSGKVNVSDNQVDAYGTASTTASTEGISYVFSADSYANAAFEFYSQDGYSDENNKVNGRIVIIDSSDNVVEDYTLPSNQQTTTWNPGSQYFTVLSKTKDGVAIAPTGDYRIKYCNVTVDAMEPYNTVRYYTTSTKYPSYQSAEAIENNVYPALDSIEMALDGKQNTLSAGTGIVISGDVISVTGVPNVDQTVISGSTNPVAGGAVYNELQGKQDTLVSGTSIKTVNNESVLGSGNIATLQAEVSGTTLIFS